MPAVESTANPASVPSSRQRWLEVALILLVFYLNSGWAVPDNNEAHYLGKARHYWDPSFCAGDAFFESAHTHQVFYAVFGWWTLFLPLPAVAWIGRLLTWSLLAIGWQRLSWRVVPKPWWSIFSAALMVALQERFQVAGEWLVGGFEAKGIAYALMFFALEAAFAGKWRAVWLWLGAASAWHVLVGGWAVVAMLYAWWFERRRMAAPTLRALFPALTLGFLISMPALVPALELTRGAEPATVAEANQFYVFERLPHHLNPLGFPPRGVAFLAALVITTGVLSRLTPATAATRIAWRFALASAGLSLVGWAIAVGLGPWPEHAAALLKYYWFRLADVAIPLSASLLAVAYLQHAIRTSPGYGRAWLTAVGLFTAFHLVDFGIQTQTLPYPRADRPGKVVDHAAWVEVCEWIKQNTPPGAKFITPRQNQTFKWYAERPEVATWKDVPQDAKAIVRWKRKLDDVYGSGEHWYDGLAKRSWDEIRNLGKDEQAEYLILDAGAVGATIYDSPINDAAVSRIIIDPVHHDPTGYYWVYKLTDEPFRLPSRPSE